MSFKDYASAVSLANRALGMIAEGPVASLEDPGNKPAAINRWYKPVVARLLQMHHWGLATKRTSLVETVNDRGSEWAQAYAPPIDMAFPVAIGQSSGASRVSYYRGLGGLMAMLYGRPIFQNHNGKLYSNYAGDLEYVSYDITEAQFTPAFEDIVVLMLASRLARELPKDADMADNLEAKANSAINVAITQDLNSGGRQYGNTVSEAELVRGALAGNDYFPIGLPRG